MQEIAVCFIMVEISYSIVNVKCSYKVNSEKNIIYYKDFIVSKTRKSFLVIRSATNPLVFCYFSPHHVNITGIRNFSIFPSVKFHLKKIFQIDDQNINLKIDNITAKLFIQSNSSQFFLPKIADFISSRKCLYMCKSVKFDAERFSGLFIRFVFDSTVLLFRSKKAMSVGCKTEQNISKTKAILKTILTDFDELHT